MQTNQINVHEWRESTLNLPRFFDDPTCISKVQRDKVIGEFALKTDLTTDNAPIISWFEKERNIVTRFTKQSYMRFSAGWFWEIIAAMCTHHRRKFFNFVTAQDGPPSTGFRHLKPAFEIYATNSADELPVAHTCFNKIEIPGLVPSKEELSRRICLAVENCRGFTIA